MGGFTIYFSEQVFFQPINQSLFHMGSVAELPTWRGNILVIKNAAKDNVVDCKEEDKGIMNELVVR